MPKQFFDSNGQKIAEVDLRELIITVLINAKAAGKYAGPRKIASTLRNGYGIKISFMAVNSRLPEIRPIVKQRLEEKSVRKRPVETQEPVIKTPAPVIPEQFIAENNPSGLRWNDPVTPEHAMNQDKLNDWYAKEKKGFTSTIIRFK